MLDFEVALACAEARVGIVPKSAADRIAAAAHASEFDMDALSSGHVSRRHSRNSSGQGFD